MRALEWAAAVMRAALDGALESIALEDAMPGAWWEMLLSSKLGPETVGWAVATCGEQLAPFGWRSLVALNKAASAPRRTTEDSNRALLWLISDYEARSAGHGGSMVHNVVVDLGRAGALNDPNKLAVAFAGVVLVGTDAARAIARG